jgi:hypothetical protein
MSGWKDGVSRRPLLAALGAIVGIGVVAGGSYEIAHWQRRTGRYEALLAVLPDRDAAIIVGRAVLAGAKSFDAHAIAAGLKPLLAKTSLAGFAAGDAAQGRITEVRGWVFPVALAQLCALAAAES